MKIFIIGLPQSGRTTVAKAIAGEHGFKYIDAMSWVRSTFREIRPSEHPHQYEDDYQQYLTKRMMVNPWFVTEHIYEMMKVEGNETSTFIVDGIASPRDFTALFDYRDEHDYRDHENIGTSVIRDYCFWMSAAGLLPKERWLEYNFKIPGEDSDHVKAMGAQNSVFIVKSIKKVTSHLSEKIKEIIHEVSQ